MPLRRGMPYQSISDRSHSTDARIDAVVRSETPEEEIAVNIRMTTMLRQEWGKPCVQHAGERARIHPDEWKQAQAMMGTALNNQKQTNDAANSTAQEVGAALNQLGEQQKLFQEQNAALYNRQYETDQCTRLLNEQQKLPQEQNDALYNRQYEIDQRTRSTQSYWGEQRRWNQSPYAEQYRENELSAKVKDALQNQLAETSRQKTRIKMLEAELARTVLGTATKRDEQIPSSHQKIPLGADNRSLRSSLITQPTDPSTIPPNERRSSGPASTMSMITPITEPPTLDLDRYAEWKKIVRFWSDAHGDSPSSQLVANLALSEGGALKILLTKYLRGSADRPDSRSLEDALELTDNEFDRPAQEATIHALNQMMSARRKTGGDLGLFWLRFFKLHDRLVLNNAALPPTVLFSRALEALKLPSKSRTMVLTALPSRPDEPNANDLKEITVRLFRSFGETSTALFETSEDDWGSGLAGDGAEDVAWGEHEQVMALKGKKPPRNRPGAYAASVRGSISNMDVPNGYGRVKGAGKQGYGQATGKSKGKKGLRCIRCDATDHDWRSCPLPYQPAPAFFRRMEKGGDNKSGNPVLMMGSLVGPPMEPSSSPGENPQVLEAQSVPDVYHESGHENAPPERRTEWDFWETADWARMVERIAYSQTPMEGELFYSTAILDAGPSTSVASVGRVQRWGADFISKLLQSDKTFRFGPGTPAPSIGTYDIEASITLTNDQQKKGLLNCSFTVDVGSAVAPLLVSRPCLQRMGAILNFNENSLLVGNMGRCRHQISRNIHYLLHLEPPVRGRR